MMTPDAVTQSNNQALATAVAAVSGSSDEKPAGEIKTIENSEAGSKTSVHSKVIKPLNDLSNRGNHLQELLAQEEAQTTADAAKAKAIEAVVNQVKEEEQAKDQAVIAGTETVQPNDPSAKVPTV
jgi:hypothetical protein